MDLQLEAFAIKIIWIPFLQKTVTAQHLTDCLPQHSRFHLLVVGFLFSYALLK